MSTWTLVEITKPNDSRKVLAFFLNEYGKGRQIIARYYPPRTHRADDICWDGDTPDDWFDTDEDGNSWIPEGWYEECETQEDARMVDIPISHWMDLPESPK